MKAIKAMSGKRGGKEIVTDVSRKGSMGGVSAKFTDKRGGKEYATKTAPAPKMKK